MKDYALIKTDDDPYEHCYRIYGYGRSLGLVDQANTIGYWRAWNDRAVQKDEGCIARTKIEAVEKLVARDGKWSQFMSNAELDILQSQHNYWLEKDRALCAARQSQSEKLEDR